MPRPGAPDQAGSRTTAVERAPFLPRGEAPFERNERACPGAAPGTDEAMDPEQQSRFRQAVDRKSEDAEARSRAGRDTGGPPPEEEGPPGSQSSLSEKGRPQDAMSPRDKNSRHGKVTADKWNQ